MKELVADVVRRFGGTAQEADGRLEVELPAEGEGAALAERLGGSALSLVFDAADVGPGRQLVAPGSHVLRQLDAFLSARGQHAYVERPAERRLTLAALRAALQPASGLKLALEQRATGATWDVYVVYQLRFVSLDREDALETVRVRLRPGRPPEVDLEEPPEEAVKWPSRVRKRVAPEAWAVATAEADAAIARHARARGEERREEARSRLQRDLSRLQAYYAGQVAEYRRRRTTELSLLRVEELEEERELRVRELIRSTEVRVEVLPLQALAVEVPLQTARLVVRPAGGGKAAEAAPEGAPEGASGSASSGGAPAGLAIAYDRAEGELLLPPCPACAGPLGEAPLAMCGAGHVVHEREIGPCRGCGALTCAACDLEPCDVCRGPLCKSCGEDCPGCGLWVCGADRDRRCARCDRAGCAGCLHPCAHCGAVVCAEHRHPATSDSEAVVCATCAQPCPGCSVATLAQDLIRCERCGRRFCATCHPRDAATCVLCAG